MASPQFPRLNTVPLRQSAAKKMECQEEFSVARSKSRGAQRRDRMNSQSHQRSVSRGGGGHVASPTASPSPASAPSSGPPIAYKAKPQMRFHQLLSQHARASSANGNASQVGQSGVMSPAVSSCVANSGYTQNSLASKTTTTNNRSTKGRSRTAAAMKYAAPAGVGIAILENVAEALQHPKSEGDQKLKQNVDNVGKVPHSSLEAGERPWKGGQPGFSALVNGFLGENPTWRTFHRTPARVDYQGRPINCADDVKMQTKDRAQQLDRLQKKAKIQDSGMEETDSALLDKLFDTGKKAPFLKYSVTYDYSGKRIVMDAIHCPVPPKVHQMKENYFKPNPWDFGSPVQ